jgi:AraC family transcriptional regulator of adaptative response/methylated-DNA-[protein]-cysteine methyltransferase
LFDVAFETGLSGTGRLHDLFVNIEGMTPGDYKNGGESLTIRYSFSESPFGKIMIASTKNGICHIVFTEDEEEGRQTLKQQFPKAVYKTGVDHYHEEVIRFFGNDIEKPCQIKLHLKGTPFQLKVWDALLKIPSGVLTTYGDIAHSIDSPKASRAVGTAIGSNPIAYIIPCHRVIQSSGNFGGYMWGPTRKTAIIGWEAAQLHR